MKIFRYKSYAYKNVLSILGKDFVFKKAETDLSNKVQNILNSNKPLNIIIGAGNANENDFISTQQKDLDLLDEYSWEQIPENSVNIFFAEHVWEHLTLDDGIIAIKNCMKHLKTGGHIRIAVPDGFHPNKFYIDYVKPNGHGAGAFDHKVLYNYQIIKDICEKNNWKLNLLEYWDEKGEFHYSEWDAKDGMVYRSKRFDERNTNGELNYTSLIFDIVK